MLTFPTHLFRPANVQLRRSGMALTGGESLSGQTDMIRTDGGGYWIVNMSGIELFTPDAIRAWRAWEDHLDGGVEPVLVPVADVRQAPYSSPSPGPTSSGFQSRANMEDSRLVRGREIMGADVVAAAGYDALMANRPVFVTGRSNWATSLMPRFLPRRIIPGIVKRAQGRAH